jgi:hypothetical protein
MKCYRMYHSSNKRFEDNAHCALGGGSSSLLSWLHPFTFFRTNSNLVSLRNLCRMKQFCTIRTFPDRAFKPSTLQEVEDLILSWDKWTSSNPHHCTYYLVWKVNNWYFVEMQKRRVTHLGIITPWLLPWGDLSTRYEKHINTSKLHIAPSREQFGKCVAASWQVLFVENGFVSVFRK